MMVMVLAAVPAAILGAIAMHVDVLIVVRPVVRARRPGLVLLLTIFLLIVVLVVQGIVLLLAAHVAGVDAIGAAKSHAGGVAGDAAGAARWRAKDAQGGVVRWRAGAAGTAGGPGAKAAPGHLRLEVAAVADQRLARRS